MTNYCYNYGCIGDGKSNFSTFSTMKLALLPLPNIELTENLKILQFKDIQNPVEVLNAIKTNENFPLCCCLDASRIISEFQLSVAATKAFLFQSQGKLRTNSIYSEILMNLSPNTSITEAFKFFGLNAKTRSIFVILETVNEEVVKRALMEFLHGDLLETLDFSELI
jgi:hypothetical protein